MASTANEPIWDVFVSYARADRDDVEGVIGALRARGMRVFVDDPEIPAFTSITAEIRAALAGSKLLLPFFSRKYLTRMACRWELDYALRAGYAEGNPFGRVAAVNPEPDMDHILYVELRSTRLWELPDSPMEARRLADDIAGRLAALDGPIGELPASERFPSPAAFCGRDLELHELNAHLGLNAGQRAEAMSRSPKARTAFVVGAPGIGKSAFIGEYLHRFGEQFAEVHHCAGQVPADHPLGLVVIEDLRIEDAPRVRQWLADQPTTCTAILSAREHLHVPASPVVLDGLDFESTLALLSAYRPVEAGQAEPARRLAEGTGGHPQTAHVVGHLLQTFAERPYESVLREWHRRDADAIGEFARRMSTLQDGYPADFNAGLVAAFPPEDSTARSALRVLAAMPPLAARTDLLAEALIALGHPERPSEALETLRRCGLVAHGRLGPVAARVAERHDTDPVAWSVARTAAEATYDGLLHTGRRMESTVSRPSDESTEIAFQLQIELSTRIATQPLPDGQGLLGEALASLKSVFDAARDALKQLGSTGHRDEAAQLANKLCETLRPFLTEWHPRLSDHASTRPPGVGVLTHENAWEHAAELRAELPGLQESLAEILTRLRGLTGSDL
ncbi:toll/interleukin-1 receptor domain-containing protein [Glycomyces buryatensis]|uniref:toll/interleukin-1 receptor domain-containing protein n=1 Tax=Glycomyces buryatensis TaxID=2570927 RepID=UPI0014562B3A|nr:toll/interleukin-1 receptor domain-containing protein [Glycomyces buryatensis]